MICSFCGKEFQNDMNFCPYCGTPAVKNEQQEPFYNYAPNYNQSNNDNGQNYGGQPPYGNGQYYGGQIHYGYNPPNPKDVPSAGFNVLSFFIPIVGLILYLVWKDEMPKRAKAVGKWALISVIVRVVLYILMMIAMFALVTVAGVSTYTYMM